MKIVNATLKDIDTIFQLYDDATEFQKEKKVTIPWAGFKRALIEEEINEGRLFKITDDGAIACVFSIAFTDPLIWKEKNSDPAIYIHRIATSKHKRGRGYTTYIVDWARDFGKAHQKQFVRLDTNSDNYPLHEYYKRIGFTQLDDVKPTSIEALPKHYETITLATFELEI